MDELSAGIVAWLGHGVAASPRADAGAVRALATSSPPDELVARVREVVAESEALPVDWGSVSLADAGRAAAAEMARRHPGLDLAALDALAWSFTYAWR